LGNVPRLPGNDARTSTPITLLLKAVSSGLAAAWSAMRTWQQQQQQQQQQQ